MPIKTFSYYQSMNLFPRVNQKGRWGVHPAYKDTNWRHQHYTNWWHQHYYNRPALETMDHNYLGNIKVYKEKNGIYKLEKQNAYKSPYSYTAMKKWWENKIEPSYPKKWRNIKTMGDLDFLEKKSKATACIDCRDEAHAIML